MQRAVLGRLVDTDGPCRTMPGDRLFLVPRDLAVGQAGKVIVALVVVLDVLEAEQEKFSLCIASYRRAVDPRLVTASCGCSLLRRVRMRSKYLESSFMIP